jgi:hypothetical protein
MAVLDQDLRDLHAVQRAIGGAVAKAFARKGARVLHLVLALIGAIDGRSASSRTAWFQRGSANGRNRRYLAILGAGGGKRSSGAITEPNRDADI